MSEALRDAAVDAAPDLTYLAPFSFEVQRDGSLKAPPLDDFSTIARQNGVTLMMVLTNLENTQFSSELGSIIFNERAGSTGDQLLEAGASFSAELAAHSG